MFTISSPVCKTSYKNQSTQEGVTKLLAIVHFYQNTRLICIWTMECGLDITNFLTYSRLSQEMFQALYTHQINAKYKIGCGCVVKFSCCWPGIVIPGLRKKHNNLPEQFL